MTSKKEPSKKSGFFSIFGGEESSDSEQEKEKPGTVAPPPEKKGGKTRRVEKYGSRRKVWNGSAERTKGGLRKEDLIQNARGRIVSAKRHTTMKNRHNSS